MIMLDIKYNATDTAAAKAFAGMINKNLDNVYFDYDVFEVDDGDDSGKYAFGNILIGVEENKLNAMLVNFDTIKHGFWPGSIDVMEQVHQGIRLKIVRSNDHEVDSLTAINQLTDYIHNLQQEHATALSTLEDQTRFLEDEVENLQEQITNTMASYTSMMVWLNSVVDIQGLNQRVHELAQQIEFEFDEDYKLIGVH